MLGLARAAVIQLYGWVALATVTLLSLSARSNAPQAAHKTGAIRRAQLTDMTSLEWRALGG